MVKLNHVGDPDEVVPESRITQHPAVGDAFAFGKTSQLKKPLPLRPPIPAIPTVLRLSIFICRGPTTTISTVKAKAQRHNTPYPQSTLKQAPQVIVNVLQAATLLGNSLWQVLHKILHADWRQPQT